MRTLVFAAMLLLSPAVNAYEWRDTPLMSRLKSISNQRVLVGLQKLPANSDTNKNDTLGGVVPAMQMFDLHGFSLGHRDENERRIVQRRIDAAKAWIDRGGVAQFHWHWPHPLNPKGSAWLDEHGRFEASPPFSLQQAIIDGTTENQAVIRDLEWVSQFLEQLGDREFVFRPLWEMEGAWFWWGTGTAKTGNTPEDYRAFNIYVRKWFESRGVVDNAIWLYSMAPTVFGKGHHTNAVDIRQRCYPGGYDLIGFSIYPNGSNQWGAPDESDWQNAYTIANAVDPDSPYVISECEKLPNPDLMAEHDQKPLWAGHWYDGPNKTTTFANHPLYMGLDEWAKDEPDKPSDPKVIVDLAEGGRGDVEGWRGKATRYDGSNPLVLKPGRPIRFPITVMAVFNRESMKTPVQMCELIGLRVEQEGSSLEKLYPFAACDAGENQGNKGPDADRLRALRNRHVERVDGENYAIPNGSTPGVLGIGFTPGAWHHGAWTFRSTGDITERLRPYIDDNPESFQSGDPRNVPHVPIPDGFDRIEIGNCNKNGDSILLSHIRIVEGIVPFEAIADRARSLGLPYRDTLEELVADGRVTDSKPIEPPAVIDRWTLELREANGQRELILNKQ